MEKRVKSQSPNESNDSVESRQIQVLCVDDEISVLNSSKQILEMKNEFVVETASSVTEALEKMECTKFDVVVSDYQMPEKNGLDFLKELRESGNDVPFILFTGKAREEVAIKALNLGADRFFNKFGHPETVYGELVYGIRQAVAQRRAEKEVLEREELMRAMFGSSPDAIIIADLTGKVVDCNQKALDLVGASSKNEILGTKGYSFILKEDFAKITTLINEFLEKGAISPADFRVLTKNGSIVPVEFSVDILRNASGKAIGAVGIVRNVTDRKKAEEALKQSEEKYRTIVELSPDGIVSVDTNGIITSVNSAILTRTGFSEEDFLGKHFTQLLALQKDPPPNYKKVVDAFLSGEFPHSFEFNYTCKDGTQRSADARIGLLKQNGTLVGLQVIFRDVTERNKVEKELKESEDRYRKVVENVPDSILTFDLNGSVTSCNFASLALTGFSENEVVGKHFSELVHNFSTGSKDLLPMFNSLVNGKVPEPFEVSYVNSNGDCIFGEVHASLMKEGDNITGFQVVMRDITKHKMKEESLRDSEQHFRDLTKFLPEVIFEMDAKGVLKFTNHEAYTLFGYSKEEFNQGLNALDLLIPEDRDRCRKNIEKILCGETLGSREYTALKKDGSTFQISVHSTPILYDGAPVGLRGIMVDITERKKTENVLKESEEKFRTLAEQSPNMIFINQDGKIVYVNPKCEEQMGYTKEEFYSSDFSFLDLISHEHKDIVMSNFRKHVKGKEAYPCEYSLVTKEGKRIEAILTTKLIKYDGKTAILGIITDITERKKAESALQEERQLLEHITDRIGIVIGCISPDYRVLWGNNVLKRMHEQLEGQICYKLFAKRKKICTNCGVREVLETGKDLVVTQETVPDANGDPHWLELYATPVRDKQGKITSVLELVIDINERKVAEKKIDEMMNKLMMTNEKLEVVGKLTRHDARNKLSVIVNNIYLAKKQLPQAHEALEYLDAIDSVTGQMANIFDFARIYEKVGTEKLSYVDVKKAAKEAISLILCSDKTKFVVDCDRLVVLADSLLRQMFYNLIDNSLKHGKSVTRIRFHFKEGENSLKLIYEDNGCGIPKEEKEKIFEEGYGKGTGYGLYLIKKTCDAYGWPIKENGTYGKGAKFTLTIPQKNKDEKTAYLAY